MGWVQFAIFKAGTSMNYIERKPLTGLFYVSAASGVSDETVEAMTTLQANRRELRLPQTETTRIVSLRAAGPTRL
jgi:predicted DNA-binding helix-hairpin-helix protein